MTTQCLQASLCYDDHGNEVALTVCADIRDKRTGEIRRISKTVDLSPLVDLLHEKFLAYHASLHPTQISGWGDTLHKAKEAAKRIATAHASNDVKNALKVVFPVYTREAQKFAAQKFFGDKGPKMVDDLYHAVQKARRGNPASIQAFAKLANAAQSNPEAAKVLAASKVLNTAIRANEQAASLPPAISKTKNDWSSILRVGQVIVDDEDDVADVYDIDAVADEAFYIRTTHPHLDIIGRRHFRNPFSRKKKPKHDKRSSKRPSTFFSTPTRAPDDTGPLAPQESQGSGMQTYDISTPREMQGDYQEGDGLEDGEEMMEVSDGSEMEIEE